MLIKQHQKQRTNQYQIEATKEQFLKHQIQSLYNKVQEYIDFGNTRLSDVNITAITYELKLLGFRLKHLYNGNQSLDFTLYNLFLLKRLYKKSIRKYGNREEK